MNRFSHRAVLNTDDIASMRYESNRSPQFEGSHDLQDNRNNAQLGSFLIDVSQRGCYYKTFKQKCHYSLPMADGLHRSWVTQGVCVILSGSCGVKASKLRAMMHASENHWSDFILSTGRLVSKWVPLALRRVSDASTQHETQTELNLLGSLFVLTGCDNSY